MVIAHNNWYILSKLILLLDDSRNDIYVHVDQKSDFSDDRKLCLTSLVKKSNIRFIDRLPVTWGGFSLINVTLKLLKAATGEYHYSYYHLLSGCDLPLMNQNQIHAFFDAHQGAEFIGFGKKEWIKSVQDRFKYYWLFQECVGNSKRIDKIILRAFDRVFVALQRVFGVNRISNLDYSAGSEWFSITDDFARYMLSKEKFIKKHFKYGICADESFVQTIAINSNFEKKIFNRYSNVPQECILRYIQWNQGKPRLLEMKDFNEIMNSGCLFARKFDKNNKDIVDRIYDVVKPNIHD